MKLTNLFILLPTTIISTIHCKNSLAITYNLQISSNDAHLQGSSNQKIIQEIIIKATSNAYMKSSVDRIWSWSVAIASLHVYTFSMRVDSLCIVNKSWQGTNWLPRVLPKKFIQYSPIATSPQNLAHVCHTVRHSVIDPTLKLDFIHYILMQLYECHYGVLFDCLYQLQLFVRADHKNPKKLLGK